MGKTFKDYKEIKTANKLKQLTEGPKLEPYKRNQERKTKCTKSVYIQTEN